MTYLTINIWLNLPFCVCECRDEFVCVWVYNLKYILVCMSRVGQPSASWRWRASGPAQPSAWTAATKVGLVEPQSDCQRLKPDTRLPEVFFSHVLRRNILSLSGRLILNNFFFRATIAFSLLIAEFLFHSSFYGFWLSCNQKGELLDWIFICFQGH